MQYGCQKLLRKIISLDNQSAFLVNYIKIIGLQGYFSIYHICFVFYLIYDDALSKGEREEIEKKIKPGRIGEFLCFSQ